MSGPKSSRYTLTAEQLKRILEEQERLRKELEEKAKQERECKEAREFLSSTKSKLSIQKDMIQSIQSSIPNISNISRELQEKYRTIYSLISKAESVCSVTAGTTHSVLIHSRKEAEQLLNKIVTLGDSISLESKNVIVEQKTQEDSDIVAGMKLSFENIGVVDCEAIPIYTETVNDLELLLKETLSSDLIRDINNAIEQAKKIDNVSTLQNFISITVTPLKTKCSSYITFTKESKDSFDSLHDKYKALCIQLGVQIKKIDFSEEGLKELKDVVPQLECQANNAAEQSYISHTVDEVMTEMGYEVIGHRQVKKKSGKEFKSKLLTYEDGTVINVTESSNGQITMEVGGTDNIDRMPDANERVALRKTMESFCKDFHEIEQRLSDRGVVLNSRLSMAPPEEAYAQIINLSDYELSGDYQTVFSKKNSSQDLKQKHLRDE